MITLKYELPVQKTLHLSIEVKNNSIFKNFFRFVKNTETKNLIYKTRTYNKKALVFLLKIYTSQICCTRQKVKRKFANLIFATL